ncbi:MAG TPA: tRNA (adenosine(37)-N6)-threonylcarbamoyltransferase complex ATPase subunit type 1 TsaE [Ktedonobacterales bacterium]|nr:tRNA (adenosine(37)-N6)-threonylcarbamoyltransferase complex ATPase subunit type 1 TsaE [Ktedonobacterales bacterium]
MRHRSDQLSNQASSRSRVLTLQSTSAEETRRLGILLGGMLAAGDVVLLTGDLGAGKTAFTQGIGAGLGVTSMINSPTFTILKEYAGRVPLYHFDLYRIEDPDELPALGFEDYFGGDGVCVVEWAERGEHSEPDGPGASGDTVWPASWLRVEFAKVSSSERTLRCSAMGRRGQALLAEFARATKPARRTRAEEGH